MSIFDFPVLSLRGKEGTLAPYKGKVLLIVNVASQCGFTPQYAGLETLYRRFKGSGFEVLGFPCNQFGGQEPGNESEIQSFCDSRFGVTFPLFAKVEVNGPNAHPLYGFLKKEKKGLLLTERIKWNFTKFLVDSEGKVIGRFGPRVAPEALEAKIAALLPERA